MTDAEPGSIEPRWDAIVDERGEPGGIAEPPDIDESAWGAPTAPHDGPDGDGADDGTWQESSSSRLMRSSAVVAVGTGLSRVTGLVRTMAQAYALGAFAVADAFSFANTIPNLLYDLLAGGVLAATLVPVFVDNLARRDRRATDAVVTVMGVALLVVTVLGMAAVPVIALVVPNADTRALVAAFLWMFLPQVFFYGLTTLLSGVLNSHRRFAAAAFVPVLNNVVVIAVLLVFSRWVGSDTPGDGDLLGQPGPLLFLGLGVTAGIVVQAIALWPALRRARIPLRWRFEWRNPAVRTVARLSGWTFGYVATNQVALWVMLGLTFQGDTPGEPVAYSLAYQFFQLPYGLLAASVITAFMPDLAALAAAGDRQRFGERFLLALRLTVFLVLPAAIGLVLLAQPAVATLLGHGRFVEGGGVTRTAQTLVAFAVGLVSFCLYLLAMRGFYARKDTRTPFLINLVETAVNIVLAVTFYKAGWGAPGLALSFALAYVVGAFIALAVLHRRSGGLGWAGSTSSLLRIGAAGAFMAAAVILVAGAVGGDSGTEALVRLVAGVVAGAVVYLGAAALFRVPELRDFAARFAARLPGRRATAG